MEKKTFIVSDESINQYGFRVLTSGIDIAQFKRNPIMLYMHQRNHYNPSGDEVIGRWENIRIEGTKLLADAVFDEKNEFAKKIKDKVEGGFIKMASVGVYKREISTDKEHLVKGQTRATVTKSTLQEISIVDMGGNNNALRLYNSKGEDLSLEELNLKPETDMSNFKTIALALKLGSESTEETIVDAITKLMSDNADATLKLSAFADEKKTALATEAQTLLDSACEKLGLKDEAKTTFQATYLALFKADHATTKTAINAMIESAPKGTNNTEKLNSFMKGVNGNASPEADEKLCFDYLQKHNVVELKRIKDEDPTKYAELAMAYQNGKRYTKQ